MMNANNNNTNSNSNNKSRMLTNSNNAIQQAEQPSYTSFQVPRLFKSQLEYGIFGQCICTPVCYILGHTFLTMNETSIITVCSTARIDSIMRKSHEFYAASKFANSFTLPMIEEIHVSFYFYFTY